MEITDSHIRDLVLAAEVDKAIALCQKTIAEVAGHEANARATRLAFETKLGELIAAKLGLTTRLLLK